MDQELIRCTWVGRDERMRDYHDHEWGLPLADAQRLFEFLVLDTFQAGVSWQVVLHKRPHFRAAFHGFNASRMAAYGEADVARLLADPGIIRNRRKIQGAVQNARAWLALREAQGGDAGLLRWFWQFTGGQPRDGQRPAAGPVPATSAESDAMSKALKALGFQYVGSVTCYAFMQAAGMVNDHLAGCFRHAECNRAAAAFSLD